MYSVYKVENLINGRCYIGGCLTKQIPNNNKKTAPYRGDNLEEKVPRRLHRLVYRQLPEIVTP